MEANEIVKALQCCEANLCEECPHNKRCNLARLHNENSVPLCVEVIDLIEKLTKENKELNQIVRECEANYTALAESREQVCKVNVKLIKELDAAKAEREVIQNSLINAEMNLGIMTKLYNSAFKEIPRFCCTCQKCKTDDEIAEKSGEDWGFECCGDWEWRGLTNE